MSCLTTPLGNLTEGTVVMLSKFPGTKWTVRNGTYTYQGEVKTGWYFESIPANIILPVSDDDLATLTIITDNMCWGCLPPDKPCPPPEPVPPVPNSPHPDNPRPDPPNPHQEIARLQSEVDRTFITVQTISERNRLRFYALIPDGKLVRVNHVKDEENEDEDIGPKYYRYDRDTDEFIEIFLENEVSGDEFEELKETVNNCLEWQYL